MELRQLRYFTCIARCGSFTKAAAEVFIAQSALSQQLALLEEELGATLFHRSRRGVELTEAGRTFHAHAVAILRQVEDAKTSVHASETDPAGKVVFGIPHSASNALALPLLMAVRRELPHVELELTEELTGNLVSQMRAGQINLAVLFDDGSLDEFNTIPLIEEELVLIGLPELHRLHHQVQPMNLDSALRLPIILPAPPHGVRPIIERAAREHGLPAPNVVADISSISILRTTLLAGLGFTLLPPMPLMQDVLSGTLEIASLADSPLESPLTRRLMLCSSRHIPLSAAAQAVSRLTHRLTADLAQSGQWKGASDQSAHGNPA